MIELNVASIKDKRRGILDLIKGWVQSKEFTVTIGLALIFIVPVNLLVGGAVEEVREEGIRERVL